MTRPCPPASSETGVQDGAGDPEPDQGEGDPCDGAEEEAGQPAGDSPVCSLCKNLAGRVEPVEDDGVVALFSPNI